MLAEQDSSLGVAIVGGGGHWPGQRPITSDCGRVGGRRGGKVVKKD